MKFVDSLEGDLAIFSLSGKILTHEDNMTRFHGRIHEYVNLNKKNVIIDLGKIELMTSVGLGMLISALATVNNAGGRMVLANITRIQNLIAITRLNTVFASYDSIEQAVESFKKG
ncbi:MAG: STAS domain-containing protein [Candidatus Zixiibacteriota bacterium]|nr:MAG: STAS domain-containing protein [candidate division Zixibacteria bacterium]